MAQCCLQASDAVDHGLELFKIERALVVSSFHFLAQCYVSLDHTSSQGYSPERGRVAQLVAGIADVYRVPDQNKR